MPEGDHETGNMKKGAVNCDQAIIADSKATKIRKPSHGSFDDPSPAVTAKFPSIGGFSASFFPVGRNQFNAIFPHFLAQGIAIVSPVGNQPMRFWTDPTIGTRWELDCLYQRFQQFYFRRRGRRQECSDRNTLALNQYHPLRALAPLGFSNFFAPFFAGAKLPSAKVSSHCNNCFCSMCASKARHAISQIPASSHSRNRRQQVIPLGNCAGISLQRAPVRKTQRIPSKHDRLLCQGRPRRSLRRGSEGNKGSKIAHCLSVNPDGWVMNQREDSTELLLSSHIQALDATGFNPWVPIYETSSRL